MPRLTLRSVISWARALGPPPVGPCAEGIAWAESHRTLKAALADPAGVEWRRWVARHPACPADVLVRLAGDADANVRCAAAAAPLASWCASPVTPTPYVRSGVGVLVRSLEVSRG